MKSSELVFIPTLGIGHLVSTLEFVKCLIGRYDRLSATVLCMKAQSTPNASAYAKSLVGSQTRIKIIELPQVDSPTIEFSLSPENYIYACIELVVPHVRSALVDILSASRSNLDSPQVSGLVLDFFCMPMIDVGNELGLPSYLFLTSNMGFLGLMLHLPTHHNQINSEFEHSDPDSILPGFVNPVPVSVLPGALFNKSGGYSTYIRLARRFRETKGIIVNSFAGLERYSLTTLGRDEETPPIYAVGPVLRTEGGQTQPRHPSLDPDLRDEIMKWLDKQPRSSVAFLCFGSAGSFGVSQLAEIASGLEQSGHRFLWCIRVPEPNSLGEILPEGFLERVGKRGAICEGWAPQAEVLGHSAVGGFVSHCGWNSVLESLWFGVPILTWPMYAEQQMNAFRMVKEFEMAAEMRLDYRSSAGDVVVADEIGSAVRRLMEGGSELRKKVKEMSEMARKAIAEGGSSFVAVGQLINDISGRN